MCWNTPFSQSCQVLPCPVSGSDLSTCQDTISPEPHPWEAVCSWLCATHCDQPVPGYLRAAVLSCSSPESSQRSPHTDAGSVYLCPCWDQLSVEVTACGEKLPALPSICSAEQELEDPTPEWKKSSLCPEAMAVSTLLFLHRRSTWEWPAPGWDLQSEGQRTRSDFVVPSCQLWPRMSCQQRAIGSFNCLLGPFVQNVGVGKLSLRKRERADCPAGKGSRGLGSR